MSTSDSGIDAETFPDSPSGKAPRLAGQNRIRLISTTFCGIFLVITGQLVNLTLLQPKADPSKLLK